MKRLIAACAVASSLALAGPAWAQAGGGAGGGSGSSGSGGAGSSTPVSEGKWYQVQSVDKDKGTVKVQDGDDITINKSTRVTRDGVASSIADVQQGDEVRAMWLHGKHEGPVNELNVRSKDKASTVPSAK
ncbi:MAG TPA: hypothetical protein VFP65_14335 [Anaeromyxobacteraceae bacterium]|nr:hypothetical protein [Anaeromyxobacteraceae bacterium]